ncbi:L-lysine 2-3-aminomutase [Penicillium crustosum]|uniref:L-lysine 2-3-aminomutase n=1 Tax=Penicillium crustosum TaxID=36656 RepID=UPI002391533C|nr:L-lysine 2-3-aminomutase [Penicillium crustosum]KAJ5394022.1 L-lysine 2-3-aminomutase [Penicillium crustosum]
MKIVLTLPVAHSPLTRDAKLTKSPRFILPYNPLVWKTGLPVRSAVLKPHAGELVVGWVTTSESSLLYVFIFTSISISKLLWW